MMDRVEKQEKSQEVLEKEGFFILTPKYCFTKN